MLRESDVPLPASSLACHHRHTYLWKGPVTLSTRSREMAARSTGTKIWEQSKWVAWALYASFLQRRFIIIIIISAHKSDLSNPWSQTQASLSIPSLHPKNTNKRREREEKNNRRENLPRSDRRREKIKQEQKNKSKDPPRISERQIDKQARQTKCQDHTNCRYRTRVAKHTPPVTGGGQRTVKRWDKEHQYSNAKNHPLLFCGIQINIMGAQTAK